MAVQRPAADDAADPHQVRTDGGVVSNGNGTSTANGNGNGKARWAGVVLTGGPQGGKASFAAKLKRELDTVEERFHKQVHQSRMIGEDHRSQAVLSYRTLLKTQARVVGADDPSTRTFHVDEGYTEAWRGGGIKQNKKSNCITGSIKKIKTQC